MTDSDDARALKQNSFYKMGPVQRLNASQSESYTQDMIGGNELEILGIAAQHGGMRLRESFTTVDTSLSK
jgi:hypothetical protein